MRLAWLAVGGAPGLWVAPHKDRHFRAPWVSLPWSRARLLPSAPSVLVGSSLSGEEERERMSAAATLGAFSAAASSAPARSSARVGAPSFRGAATARRARAASPRASIAPPHPSGPAAGEGTEGGKRAKVSMVSLGCPKNTVDGEVMLGDLFANGFDVVDDHEESDAIIVNTCGFVEVGRWDAQLSHRTSGRGAEVRNPGG